MIAILFLKNLKVIMSSILIYRSDSIDKYKDIKNDTPDICNIFNTSMVRYKKILYQTL